MFCFRQINDLSFLYLLADGSCKPHASDDRRFAVTAKPRELLTIGIGLVAVMSVGITGSLAVVGGTIFPAASLRSSLMQDFSSSSHHLLRLRLLHPVTVVLGAI
jgi:hypothetical protein